MPDLTVSLSVGANQLTTRSYTLSCEPMWLQAGVDLAGFENARALTMLPDLTSAVDEMTTYPGEYIALEPADATGDYAGCLAFLQGLVDDCNHHPKAIVHTSVEQQ